MFTLVRLTGVSGSCTLKLSGISLLPLSLAILVQGTQTSLSFKYHVPNTCHCSFSFSFNNVGVSVYINVEFGMS